MGEEGKRRFTYEVKKGPQSAARNFQPVFDNGPQSAACDFQPEKAEKDPRKKLQDQTPRWLLGKNVKESILSTTPIGIGSPKRKLVWSPETPRGKSEKFSIGETASKGLLEDVPGVMLVHGRFAIPSINPIMEVATLGIEALNLSDDKTQKQEKRGEKKKSSPTLKVGTKTPRGRGRRKFQKKVDPKQKLLPDMIREKGEVSRKPEEGEDKLCD